MANISGMLSERGITIYSGVIPASVDEYVSLSSLRFQRLIENQGSMSKHFHEHGKRIDNTNAGIYR